MSKTGKQTAKMKVTQVMIFITDLKWITSNSVKTSKYGIRDGSVGKVLAVISGIHMGRENLTRVSCALTYMHASRHAGTKHKQTNK